MNINMNNNGGSYVELSRAAVKTNKDNSKGHESGSDMNMDDGQVSLQIIRLSDIFEDIKLQTNHKPTGVIIKMDIEHFECRAFLGSPELLRHEKNQTRSDETLPILAVILEWTFFKENPNGDRCSKEQVVELTKLFLENEYTPIRVSKDFQKLNTSNFGTDWNTDILWIYNQFFNVLGIHGRY